MTRLELSNLSFVLMLFVILPVSAYNAVREWQRYNEGRQNR